jgi:predicted NBD/HSP70 family sugar kinase
MTVSDDSRSRRIGAAFLRRSESGVPFTANERRLLNLVRSEGPLTRPDLARRTDLALQSVVRLVDGLIERGFLTTGEKVNRGVGQPSVPILLAARSAFTVGASVTSDAMSLVMMDLSGRVVASQHESLNGADLAIVREQMGKTLAALVASAGIERSRVFGAGVATTGYFVDRGRLNTPATMGDWALRDLEAELSQVLDMPVWIENDGNAAAVGESLFGVGRRHRSFAYLYIAAGLGGGLILDGAPVRGFRGNAGEFTGLLPVEVRQSRPNLTLLLQLLRADGVALSGIDELVSRFEIEWPAVKTWLDRTQEALNAVVSAIAAVLDPEAIVIGGRIPPSLATRLAQRANFYAAPLRDRERPFPEVVCAEAPGDAAALGAASIPLQEYFFG